MWLLGIALVVCVLRAGAVTDPGEVSVLRELYESTRGEQWAWRR